MVLVAMMGKRVLLLRLGGRRPRQSTSDVAGVGAQVEDAGKVAFDVEEAFAQACCDFIAEVVYCATCFGVGGGALSLEVFGAVVEDLEGWRARCSGCIGAMGGEQAPTKGWTREEGSK